MDIIDSLRDIEREALDAVEKAGSGGDLEALHTRYLGRNGRLKKIMAGIKDVPAEKRPEVGRAANAVKQRILSSIKEKRARFEAGGTEDLREERVDVTAPLEKKERGAVHPISQVQAEMERIFLSMGFDVLDGPHVESEFYNFEALNIPEEHPAREHQDTFWLTCGLLLRTHTSSAQVRTYRASSPPFAVVIPGRVFRYEAVDASHENTFNQIEGFIVDTDISVANLVAVLQTVIREIFKRDIGTRLRPGYFPFVEPGYEMDFECLACSGKGCPVCSRTGWVEFLGCGMIHPRVLEYGGIDPDRYTGFAFGLGLDRLTMMLYHITDIRVFQGGDLRVLKRFQSPSVL